MDGGHADRSRLSSVIWLAPLSVQASNFGSIIFGTEPVESGAWLANNRTHKGDLHNTTTEIGAAVQWAMANALEPTLMTAVLVDDEIYDVQIRDGNWDNFLVAWTSCPPSAVTSGSHPNRVCRGQIIRFNLRNMTEYTLKQRRSTACHELRRSVGLRHVSDSDAQTCMRVNIFDRPATYRPHDHSMLESNY